MFFKVDIHTHIMPSKLPDWAERFGYGGFIQLKHYNGCYADMMIDGRFFRRVKPNVWSPEERIKDCDATGVHVQVLSTIPVLFSYWAKPQHTLEVARYLNDHIAEVVQRYPKRFVGLATVPLQDPELACKELERCVKELGMAGVEIGTHINGENLSEPKFHVFWETAQQLNACVFVHPWDMMGKETMPKYWLPWLVGMPAETSRAICSMIFGGVFEKFPRLRVAFAHGGGAFPATIGRISHGFEVRPDLCAVDNPHHPKKYLGHFYLDSLVHDETMLKYLVSLVGANRVALGSDYPFPLGEAYPGKLIESIQDFDDETKAWLLGKTALEWLNKTEKDFL